MGNGLSTDQGSFTPHGLRDVEKIGTEQRRQDWSNPEDDNMLAGAPNNEELNSLSTFNRKDGLAPTTHINNNKSTYKIFFRLSFLHSTSILRSSTVSAGLVIMKLSNISSVFRFHSADP